MSTSRVAPKTAGPLPDRLLAAMLAIVSIAVYLNTLGNGFVHDDRPIFFVNRIVAKGIAGIPELMRTPYWYGYSNQAHGIYRPLPLAVFAMQRGIFGTDPLPGHILNVLLFAACVLLLYRFLTRLAGPERRYAAFAAALLFAVHPVHTEVVANIKSCDELMCFAFGFQALNLALRYVDDGKPMQIAGAAACYLLSLLSKETSICFVLLLPLIAAAARQPRKNRTRIAAAAFAITAAAFLAIRSLVLNTYEPGAFHPTIAENALAVTGSGAERLAHSLQILGRYLKLLFVPAPLIFDYSYTTIPLQDWRSAAVWIAAFAYILPAGYAVVRLRRDRGDIASLGILMYLCGIALFSNLFFSIGATFAERFLFLPSAGFCICIAFCPGMLPARLRSGITGSKMLLRICFCAVCAVFAGLSISRNADWTDEETLFRTDLEKAPENYRIPYHLATMYVLNGAGETDPRAQQADLEEAVPLLHQSIRNYDRFSPALSQLGNIYLKTGRLDSGLYFSRRALALNPTDTFTLSNVAAYYFLQGDYREAIRLSRENLRINARNRQAVANIGACYLKLGRADSAVFELQHAWQMEPGNPRTGYLLQVAFSMNGQPDSADRYAIYAKQRR